MCRGCPGWDPDDEYDDRRFDEDGVPVFDPVPYAIGPVSEDSDGAYELGAEL